MIQATYKLDGVQADGFANGISTGKYVKLCRNNELTELCEMEMLVQTGTGRETATQQPAITLNSRRIENFEARRFK